MKVFIVEDDALYARMLRHQISLNEACEVRVFHTGKAVLKELHEKPELITLDYSLPDTSCEALIKAIKKELPDTPLIVVSAQENISTAIELLKEGAYDYIEKNDDTKERLWSILRNIKERLSLKAELKELKTKVAQQNSFTESIKGSSPGLQRIFELMRKASNTNITVSISGETGTRKELVAKAIHYNSNRADKAFVAVNISALPESLIESELFGFEKGSFTGAEQSRLGKFEEANGGTIFLDEIAEMSQMIQAKILRVIQERELEKIGSNKPVKLDVRIIVATHKDLAEEVRKGSFREDLYYRFLGLPIHLPPLRERGNDVLLLAKYFLDEFYKVNKMKAKLLDELAKKKILEYSFPGNIRELKAVVELAAVMSEGDSITENDVQFNATRPINNLLSSAKSMKELNRMIVEHYLGVYDNNVLKVAEILDIGKSTIYRMLKEKQA